MLSLEKKNDLIVVLLRIQKYENVITRMLPKVNVKYSDTPIN